MQGWFFYLEEEDVTKAVNSRELVLMILLEVEEKDSYSHLVIRNVLDKYQFLEKQERAFIKRVSEGTIENRILLDFVINQFSKVKVNKMKPVIRNILRSAVYQIKYMDSIPSSAICNEAVKLAQKKGFHNLKGFVNGVLRNIIRNWDLLLFPDEEMDEITFLSTMYSMPEWIVKKWLSEYDYMTVKTILEAYLEEHATSIRCNLSKVKKEDFITILKGEGLRVTESDYLPYAFSISGYDYLNRLQSFQDGLFQVQDLSSMMVGEVASPFEGSYVIDVCAAPGGKSLHIADKMNQTGIVEARDVSDYKVSLIEENREKTGFQNVITKVWDARQLDEDLVAKADILIADLPCSGLGVIGKKTDIKYNMTEEKQLELVKLQRDILSTVQQYVKPGGILIYSTCTINKEENMENVEWFLKEFPFKLEPIDSYLAKELQSDSTKEGFIQLLPGVHSCDGFFIARLKRME